MKDQLEDFVRKNRDAFDDREPSSEVWSGIENSIGSAGRSWKDPVVWWRAAAIFFMMLSAYLLLPQEPAKADQSVALKEFSDVEAFYFQQISNKVDMIQEFQQNDGLNGFTHDFQQLEAMYLVLKEEMKARPSQKVKDALVLNLLVRIDLLNQHLHRLEEKKVESQKAKGERST
ncbi:MAG: hypothetical protein WA874_19510 [Chryseosolibacter sp.]